ncbi:MAG: hypothetical protein RLZZ450_1432 [Pseudomonadota bacterium]|jgi:hypothetical protein
MEMTTGRLLFALLCLCACQSDTVARTELLLVVDSDLRVPEQLDRLEVHVEGPAGVAQDASADLNDVENPLPRSVALVHEGGPLGPVHAIVRGTRAGAVVLTREARLSFVAGKTLILPMHLASGCVGVSCGDLTCSEGGCTSIDIDIDSLLPYAGQEPRLSTTDGGSGDVDAAVIVVDAATPDASVVVDAGGSDAGQPDTGVTAPRDAGSDAGIKTDAGTRPDAAVCNPTPELCNALDDDCDGRVDNGFDLMTDANHCGSCPTRCGGSTRRCCAGVCRSNCP